MTDDLFAARLAWIKALRHQGLAQTQGMLLRAEIPQVVHCMGDAEHKYEPVKPPGMCCLGVAIRVLDPDADLWFRPDSAWRSEMEGQYGSDDEQSVSPYGAKMLGLTKGDVTALINMNDRGVPFREIAAVLEEAMLTGLPIHELIWLPPGVLERCVENDWKGYASYFVEEDYDGY